MTGHQLEEMVAAAADAVVIVSWCSPRGGTSAWVAMVNAAADAVVIVVLVLSSWGNIGSVAMVAAAADAVVIIRWCSPLGWTSAW